MRLQIPFLPLVLFAAPLSAQGDVPYSRSADWTSYSSGISTGGAFADINGDGFLDMVVANGNDIQRQRVDVYYNDGAGNYPTNPQWSSADIDYHGQLSVGDVDSDGWPDVAVAVFLGSGGFGDKGHVKLYRNLGGALESSPSWRSSDEFFSFSCDFGDADGDGDLDLAVATGEPYFDPADRNRIYYNNGGTLDSMPGWLSAANDHALDVSFGDADGDGDLDLAFATAVGPTRVFYQGPTGMETNASFVATDNNNQNGNTCAWADIDADGFLELAVSDNNQLSGGSGDFKIYGNNAGTLTGNTIWDDFAGNVSSVAFADLHKDGFPDLAGGIWWGGAWVYLNDAGNFPNSRDWDSQVNSVSEAIFFGDLQNDGLGSFSQSGFSNAAGRRTFYVDAAPLHAVDEVRLNGVALAATDYCYDLESGWIAIADLAVGSIEIDYQASDELDMGQTNWDSSVGNQVFMREPVVAVSASATSSTNLDPGDTLTVRAELSSSIAVVDTGILAIVAFPPNGGPYRLLEVRPANPTAFGTQIEDFSFQVPNNVPAPLLGTWELRAVLLRDQTGRADVSAEDRFNFTIQ